MRMKMKALLTGMAVLIVALVGTVVFTLTRPTSTSCVHYDKVSNYETRIYLPERTVCTKS